MRDGLKSASLHPETASAKPHAKAGGKGPRCRHQGGEPAHDDRRLRARGPPFGEFQHTAVNEREGPNPPCGRCRIVSDCRRRPAPAHRPRLPSARRRGTSGTRSPARISCRRSDPECPNYATMLSQASPVDRRIADPNSETVRLFPEAEIVCLFRNVLEIEPTFGYSAAPIAAMTHVIAQIVVSGSWECSAQ